MARHRQETVIRAANMTDIEKEFENCEEFYKVMFLSGNPSALWSNTGPKIAWISSYFDAQVLDTFVNVDQTPSVK
jgi:hypothetical protein